MDELVHDIADAFDSWGAPDVVVDHEPPDLSADYAARVIACLLERIGSSVTLSLQEIRNAPSRLTILPRSTRTGLELDVRHLAR